MKLRFKVNQATSFKRGVNADTSIVDLEVDPSAIPQEDRDLIALNLHGIEVHEPGYSSLIETNGPCLSDLLDALRAIQKQKTEEKARTLKRQEESRLKEEQAIQECAQNFALRKTKTEYGRICVTKHSDYVSYDYQAADFPITYAYAVPGCTEWIAELNIAKDKAAEARKEKYLADKVLERSTKEKETQRLATFLGWQDRLAKGYITHDGLLKAAREKIRKNHGLAYPDFPGKVAERDQIDLSDSEIALAEQWKAKLPKGAKSTLYANEDDTVVVMDAEWTEEDIAVEAQVILRNDVSIDLSNDLEDTEQD